MKEKIFKKGITRRLLSVLFVLAMVFSMMPNVTVKAAAHTTHTAASCYNVGVDTNLSSDRWFAYCDYTGRLSAGDILGSGMNIFVEDASTDSIYINNVKVVISSQDFSGTTLTEDLIIDKIVGRSIYLKSIPSHSHDSINFSNKITSAGGTLSTGNYYLDSDVTLTTNLTISGTVNLCLNGHVLKGIGNGSTTYSVITVNSGATLNLYDCNTTTEHKGTLSDNIWTWDNSGDTVIRGGVITGGVTRFANTAGAITVNGTFNMNGGTIAGNKHTVEHSGGVRVNTNGTFTMNGGVIKYNTAGRCGGGIFMSGGTFTMNGGIITSNIASNGGGAVYLLKDCNFTLNDGEISYNKSNGQHGGGGVRIENGSIFTMNGGIIKNNAATQIGGGIHTAGTFTMNGGEITGNTALNGGGVYGAENLTIGGTAQITGNTKADATTVQNLYLASGKTITLDNPTTANIGITTQTTPTESEPIEISVVNETDYSLIFVADDSDNYIVKYNSNKKIVLDVKKPEIRYSVSFNANGGRGEMDTVYVSPSNNQFQLPTCTLKPPAKKEFDGWSTSPVGVKIKTPSIEITHDVNLYAVWKDHVHEITTMNLGNEMKKESCKCGYYVIRYK